MAVARTRNALATGALQRVSRRVPWPTIRGSVQAGHALLRGHRAAAPAGQRAQITRKTPVIRGWATVRGWFGTSRHGVEPEQIQAERGRRWLVAVGARRRGCIPLGLYLPNPRPRRSPCRIRLRLRRAPRPESPASPPHLQLRSWRCCSAAARATAAATKAATRRRDRPAPRLPQAAPPFPRSSTMLPTTWRS